MRFPSGDQKGVMNSPGSGVSTDRIPRSRSYTTMDRRDPIRCAMARRFPSGESRGEE